VSSRTEFGRLQYSPKKLAAVLLHCEESALLRVRERPDGGITVIGPSGQKLHYSRAELLNTAAKLWQREHPPRRVTPAGPAIAKPSFPEGKGSTRKERAQIVEELGRVLDGVTPAGLAAAAVPTQNSSVGSVTLGDKLAADPPASPRGPVTRQDARRAPRPRKQKMGERPEGRRSP
jgi:hypothetical protein